MLKISRSAVEKHINCQRCFYLEYKHKIRPKTMPFTLNIAVDHIVKTEFDHYRAKKEPHPIFLEHNIDAVPFAHEKMDEWRENFKGLRYIDEEKGFNFGGAVDDIWQKPNGELIVIDVKATAKKVFDWEDTYSKWEYAKGYRRQIEMYQWLLKKNGFEVNIPENMNPRYSQILRKDYFTNDLGQFGKVIVNLDQLYRTDSDLNSFYKEAYKMKPMEYVSNPLQLLSSFNTYFIFKRIE